METNRIPILCGVLFLFVCLLLTLISVFLLRDAVEKADGMRMTFASAYETLREETRAPEPTEDGAPTAPVSADVAGYRVVELNGKICVLTADGCFVRFLSPNPALLPSEERNALQNGIFLSTWREVLLLEQDLSA